MKDMALVMGFLTAICAGWLALLLALVGLTRISNWVMWQVFASYEGYKNLTAYREWYLKQKGETK